MRVRTRSAIAGEFVRGIGIELIKAAHTVMIETDERPRLVEIMPGRLSQREQLYTIIAKKHGETHWLQSPRAHMRPPY